MLLYTKRAPPREPKKRSRAGCVQCKEKKKKCDEAHPICSRCAERGLACEYEPIKPRRRRADARPLDEDEAFNTSGFAGSSTLAGPSSAGGEVYGPGPSSTQMRSDSFDSYVTAGSMASMQPGSFSGPYAFNNQNNNPFLGLQGNDYLWESSDHFIPEPIGSYPETAPSENSPPSLFSSRHPSITGRPGLSPTTTGSASLSPLDQSQPQTSFSRQQESPFFTPGGIPILRSQSTSAHKPQSFSELPPPQKPLSIPSGQSRQEERILPPLSSEFSDLTPRLFEHLRGVMARMTVVHEHNGSVLKKTLSDKSVITPLVMHASCALACAHLANYGHIEESKALQWHTSIVQALLQNFQRGDTKDTETLARVAMLLLQYEIVKGGSLDVMRQHASAIFAMLNDRANHQTDVLNLYSRRFFWFDLFLSLSCRTRPTNDYSLFTSTLAYINPPFETFYNTIDQIHGLAIEIIPFLYEIAHLSDLRLQARLQPDAKHSLHIRAAGIEDRLRQWRIPQVSREFLALTSPSDTEVEGILLHGEAFRWAALLYLYVDILDTPRTSPHVTSTTTKVLDLVSRLLGLGGPVVGIIWPLFTAASEAHLRSDQDVARSCFERLMNAQRFKNVETARYACEELWRRWETGEPNLGWRDVQRDIGRDIILC